MPKLTSVVASLSDYRVSPSSVSYTNETSPVTCRVSKAMHRNSSIAPEGDTPQGGHSWTVTEIIVVLPMLEEKLGFQSPTHCGRHVS